MLSDYHKILLFMSKSGPVTLRRIVKGTGLDSEQVKQLLRNLIDDDFIVKTWLKYYIQADKVLISERFMILKDDDGIEYKSALGSYRLDEFFKSFNPDTLAAIGRTIEWIETSSSLKTLELSKKHAVDKIKEMVLCL